MLIKRNLRVSAEEYYDYLLENLYNQIRKDVSKLIRKRDLVKGFEFKKTSVIGKEKIDTHFKIEELKRPCLYRISFTTDKGYQFVSHKIVTLKDNYIEDEYEEDIKSDNIKIRLKAFIGVSKTRYNMSKTVSIIEKEIRNRK